MLKVSMICKTNLNLNWTHIYTSVQSGFSFFHVNARSLPKTLIIFTHFCHLLNLILASWQCLKHGLTQIKTSIHIILKTIPLFIFVDLTKLVVDLHYMKKKNGLHFVLRNDLSCITSNYEMVFIKITQNNKSAVAHRILIYQCFLPLLKWMKF